MRLRLLPALAIVALPACGSSPPPGSTGGDSGPLADAGTVGNDASTGGDDAGTDAAIDAAIDVVAGDAGPTTRVRIMSANTTSGTNQSYETPGIDIFQGLRPDIVLIQEFKYTAGDLRALVDTAFGPSFAYSVEPMGNIPNGIVSRYPIVASGDWTDASVSDRGFAWARIDVPGPIDLWAVSLHLLTTGATQRATEAAQLVGYIDANVPAGDYLVVGGDLNTDATDEQALVNLGAHVVVAPPYPVDNLGNPDTSTNRNRPHDWVLSRANLDARKTAVTVGSSTFPDGLVFDSRVYTPLTDVPPVVAGDSAAPGMQHMPVVRDFLLDAN